MDATTSNTAFGPILVLADTHGLTAYDAAYRELAIRRGLPLATLDHDLRKAATAARVPIL